MLIQGVREDLRALALVLEEGTPDPLHLLGVKSPRLVLIVEAGEEPGVEAHLREESGGCVRVAEGVDVPGDPRLDAELLHQEVVALLHVVDKVVKVRAGLVGHAPAGVEEIQTALLDDLAHLGLHGVRLLVPPHGEELHLDLRVVLGLVSDKFTHYILYQKLHVRALNVIFGSREVLVDSFQPADVVVRVGDHMHRERPVPLLKFSLLLFSVLLRVAVPVIQIPVLGNPRLC